jgi:hypothetical protein
MNIYDNLQQVTMSQSSFELNYELENKKNSLFSPDLVHYEAELLTQLELVVSL